jgi:hypothetical protein
MSTATAAIRIPTIEPVPNPRLLAASLPVALFPPERFAGGVFRLPEAVDTGVRVVVEGVVPVEPVAVVGGVEVVEVEATER